MCTVFFFKQKTAYDMRISDWSSDVCSSDLLRALADKGGVAGIYFMPFLRTNGQPRAADVIRHVEHAVKVAGEDHVAIGTDGGICGFVLADAYAEGQRRFYAESKAMGIAAPGEASDVFNRIPDYHGPARDWKSTRMHSNHY